MLNEAVDVGAQMIAYSALIGADAMLIQGAGGNASWKDGGTMWIKASGTWLADADKKQIFVPVSIERTLELIAAGAEDLSSARVGESSLRPSIETCLHALLPQKLVIHVHAVDVISLAARKDGKALISDKLMGLDWVWVDYIKPGPDLAREVSTVISDSSAPSVIVLANHGLVVAADTLDELQTTLKEVQLRCKVTPRTVPVTNLQKLDDLAKQWSSNGYILPQEPRCHALALDPLSLKMAEYAWVMYPDHAVFLGSHAVIVDLPIVISVYEDRPKCCIIPGHGVVVRNDFSLGQQEMLACYSDVALRIPSVDLASPLSRVQIADLLDWDAEKYRQNINSL